MQSAARFRLPLAVAVSASLHGAFFWVLFSDRLAVQSDSLYELQLSPGFAVTPASGAVAQQSENNSDSAPAPRGDTGAGGVSGALTRSISELKLSIPYPALARSMNLEGRTLIQCRLAPDGQVLEARVTEGSGHRVLDLAALNAVRAWRFPAGAPEKLVIPVEFRLQGTGRAL